MDVCVSDGSDLPERGSLGGFGISDSICLSCACISSMRFSRRLRALAVFSRLASILWAAAIGSSGSRRGERAVRTILRRSLGGFSSAATLPVRNFWNSSMRIWSLLSLSRAHQSAFIVRSERSCCDSLSFLRSTRLYSSYVIPPELSASTSLKSSIQLTFCPATFEKARSCVLDVSRAISSHSLN